MWCGWPLVKVFLFPPPTPASASALTMSPGLIEHTVSFVEVIYTAAEFAHGPGTLFPLSPWLLTVWLNEVTITCPLVPKPTSLFCYPCTAFCPYRDQSRGWWTGGETVNTHQSPACQLWGHCSQQGTAAFRRCTEIRSQFSQFHQLCANA